MINFFYSNKIIVKIIYNKFDYHYILSVEKSGFVTINLYYGKSNSF